MSRPDAAAKATGAARYVGDLSLPGCAHAAIVRSSVVHGRILGIDASEAAAIPGVVGVFSGEDVSASTFGRSVRDIPILARERARYLGEPVAAVVAETRRIAEAAAAMVVVDYAELPAVTSVDAALVPSAPLVHDAPWTYPRAAVEPEDGRNLQSVVVEGSARDVATALAGARHVVERTYTTPSVHQGYLEPQACLAAIEPDGRVRVFLTNKSPYNLRRQIAECLELDEHEVEVEPAHLGGDFGGKGSPGVSLLCVELARLTGRPVKLVLRYGEDLSTTNPRHPSVATVRLGCDEEGRFVGLDLDVVFDGGAYGGFKPSPQVTLHGPLHDTAAYRLPAFHTRSRIAYTNTVPRGHMRAPGSPQTLFALESAIDELAAEVGLDPVELRRRNLLTTGETDAHGNAWVEYRGHAVLDAALAAFSPRPAPPGWLWGSGVAYYQRETPTSASTSLRLVPLQGNKVRVEVGMIETGTGNHAAVRQLIADALGLAPDDVEVRQVTTEQLPRDPGVGGSRVTANIALAADAAARAFASRSSDEPLLVEVDERGARKVGSAVVQIAQVAVDPESGELKVLEVLSVVDVAAIVNPKAFQMQVDGGTAMGYGFACLEDLDERDGQVFAANLGEFKLPSSRDVPALRTVLVPGGTGVGAANVKNVGESTTPPTAAAIANALAAATGCRIRTLPLTAERIFAALRERAR